MHQLDEGVWVVFSGCSSASVFAWCLQWCSVTGKVALGSGGVLSGTFGLLFLEWILASMTKGLISSGRLTGGSWR